MNTSKAEIISRVLARRIEQRISQTGLSPTDKKRFRGFYYPPENPTEGQGWVSLDGIESTSRNFGQFKAMVDIVLLYPAAATDYMHEAMYRLLDPTYDFGLYRAFMAHDFLTDPLYTSGGAVRPEFAALDGFDNASDSYKSIVINGQAQEGNISVSVEGLAKGVQEMLNGSYYTSIVTSLIVYWSSNKTSIR